MISDLGWMLIPGLKIQMVPREDPWEDCGVVAYGEREKRKLSGAGELQQARGLCAVRENGGQSHTHHDKV